MVKVTPWQPSGALAPIDTTLAIDWAPLVALAPTGSDRPVAEEAVTLEAEQAPGFDEVMAPGVIESNVTA